MLPRQEIAFGKNTWVIHGFGWGLFHIAFGWQLLITLMPLIFIQSYIVQRTKNSWIGVLMHGGLNGPSFIAIYLDYKIKVHLINRLLDYLSFKKHR
jgi:membrane protease YdiL (CAAX protease family)